jgi:hypothetical protein
MTRTMHEQNDRPDPSADVDTRAPYAAPRLLTFGTFAALTQTAGMTSTLADKAGGGNNKTH